MSHFNFPHNLSGTIIFYGIFINIKYCQRLPTNTNPNFNVDHFRSPHLSLISKLEDFVRKSQIKISAFVSTHLLLLKVSGSKDCPNTFLSYVLICWSALAGYIYVPKARVYALSSLCSRLFFNSCAIRIDVKPQSMG